MTTGKNPLKSFLPDKHKENPVCISFKGNKVTMMLKDEDFLKLLILAYTSKISMSEQCNEMLKQFLKDNGAL